MVVSGHKLNSVRARRRECLIRLERYVESESGGGGGKLRGLQPPLLRNYHEKICYINKM